MASSPYFMFIPLKTHNASTPTMHATVAAQFRHLVAPAHPVPPVFVQSPFAYASSILSRYFSMAAMLVTCDHSPASKEQESAIHAHTRSHGHCEGGWAISFTNVSDSAIAPPAIVITQLSNRPDTSSC